MPDNAATSPDATLAGGETVSDAIDLFCEISPCTVSEANDTRATANVVYTGDEMTGQIQASGDIVCFALMAPASGLLTVNVDANNGTLYTTKSMSCTVASGTTYCIVAKSISPSNRTARYAISIHFVSFDHIDR